MIGFKLLELVDGVGGEGEEDRIGELERSREEYKTERVLDARGEGKTRGVEKESVVDEVEGKERRADMGKKTVTGTREGDT